MFSFSNVSVVYRSELKKKSFLLSAMSVFIVVPLVAGCTEGFVGSYNVDDTQNQGQVGVTLGYYMLPRGLIRVQLKELGGRFTINVVEPTFVGDPTRAYSLRYSESPFSSDTIDVDIDHTTGLLKSINAKAEDKLDDIIVAAARSAAVIFETAQPTENEIILVDRMIDPAKTEEVNSLQQEMNFAAMQFSSEKMSSNCGADHKLDKKEEESRRVQVCKIYQAFSTGQAINFSVEKPKFEYFDNSQTVAAQANECRTGVCFRSLHPYGITFSFNGPVPTKFSTVVGLPNESPAIPLEMIRSSTVTRVSNVTLVNGMVQKFHIEKPSEALDIVSIPLNVAKAIFGTIAELVQLKIDLTGKEEAQARKDIALIQAERDLRKEQATKLESSTGAGSQLPVVLQGSNGAPAPARPSLLPSNTLQQPNRDQAASPPLGEGTEDPNQ
jgi:hypothetical protein